jgi:hypothetical protein
MFALRHLLALQNYFNSTVAAALGRGLHALTTSSQDGIK